MWCAWLLVQLGGPKVQWAFSLDFCSDFCSELRAGCAAVLAVPLCVSSGNYSEAGLHTKEGLEASVLLP